MNIETLATALQNAFNGKIPKPECTELAWNVLDYFGYGTRLLSNQLSSTELALFYQLEDIGLMRTEITTEFIPHLRKNWKIYQFVLCEDRITELATHPVSATAEINIYKELPATAFHNSPMEARQ